ncbi:MAG: PQQ-like beta-propeller repeat protein [Planctomycetes bacterium]|nr:PQQ-like beta-propeller repeat protein [Planctomycetota bacterium]
MSDPKPRPGFPFKWMALPLAAAAVVFYLLFLQSDSSAPLLEPRQVYFCRNGLWIKDFHAVDVSFSVASQGQTLRESPPLPCARGLLIGLAWQKGETYELRARSAQGEQSLLLQAPLKPAPCLVNLIDLEDILPLRANEAESNQASVVRFSSDGALLVIGTQRGFFRVMETTTGRSLLEKRITEGHVRSACFSVDSGTVYVGEQTPDGFVTAIRVRDGQELWRFRLADDLESSVPNDPRSDLAWAQLPGAYRLITTPSGDLLVLGLHSWEKDGKAVGRSRIYRLDPATGKPRWAYPAEGPMPLSIPWMDASFKAHRLAFVAVSPYHADPGEDTGKFRPGRLHVLDGETGDILWFYNFQPLTPYFTKVQIWRSIGVSPDGKFVCAATSDGRAYIFEEAAMLATSGRKPEVWIGDLATPVDMAGEPVVATTGLLATAATGPLFLVGNSFVPAQSSDESVEPPSVHPAENSLNIFQWQGHRLIWRWPTPNVPSGLKLSAGEQTLVITLSHPYRYRREDVNGFQVFDMYQQTPEERFLYEYRLEGPVAYDQFDLSADGRWVAVVEIPIPLADGVTTLGRYRLHVVH